MDFSSYLSSAPTMTPQPFKPLWEDATFANLFHTLPTVLTSSLFMLFGLLEVVLACLKWVLFLVIIVGTFLLGLALLAMAVLVLVGAVMGLAAKEGDAEVREDAEQEVDNKGKVEQEEAILEPDTEEAATQLPRKPATLGIYNSDDLTVVEAEGRLEESWAGIDAEIRERYEKDAIQREREDAKEA